MGNKKKRPKKVDIRKKRDRLIKERKKSIPKDVLKQQEKKSQQKTESDKKLDIRLKRETNLYWIRTITGALSALVGRLFIGFIGWILLLWMLFFWFLFPFICNILLKYQYEKEEWGWKNVIKPGIGMFFFMFMITSTLTHTFLAFLV